ncbi:MAG TPA: MBL fold metallo-hydrolase, partial [Myxococcota bacterium]
MRDTWTTIDDATTLLVREYRFANNGRANTLVVRGDDGLIVVSPGSNMDAAALDEIAERGPVRALIANNAWHHLGQPAWRARFPDAVSYAPPEAIAALRKKYPGIAWQPLSSLRWPGHVHWRPTPGISIGEAAITVETKRGPVLYAGDLLA